MRQTELNAVLTKIQDCEETLKRKWNDSSLRCRRLQSDDVYVIRIETSRCITQDMLEDISRNGLFFSCVVPGLYFRSTISTYIPKGGLPYEA